MLPLQLAEAPAQAPLIFALPRPLGSLLEALVPVGGDPPGRAPCRWLEEHGPGFTRLLERRPVEADGRRRFGPDDVVIVTEGQGPRVYSLASVFRTWDRYLPGTLRKCAKGQVDALQLVAISSAGLVDVFDVDRALAVRSAA